MAEVTRQEVLRSAGHTAALWLGDWKIYLDELQRLTGLTFEQACLFDMMCTLRDLTQHQVAAIKDWQTHLKDEHGPELWTG